MRFMTLVKSAENFGPPPTEFMEAIGRLTEEEARAGVLVQTGGLLPSMKGARIRLSRGKLNFTDGPFTETKELVGGYAVFQVKSKQEAIDAAARFLELHRVHWPDWEGEIEIRQIFDPANG